ncbi:MAG TPA: hypothetical protein PJ994_10765 [Tepidiformaceae bacterium]|nr:hypothetical protein [Tepidiformaceae bacterium]HMO97424.1 hypothetical protein [Tepidiformaceae bacterium]
MSHPLLDFLGPTRKAMVLAIKERAGATAAELSQAVFLSIAATRAHLLTLERANLVVHERRRDGVGRPSHLYRLSEQGEALFPQAYEHLANTIIELAEQHIECGPLLWGALEEHRREAMSREVTAPDPVGRMQQTALALNRRGYAAELRATGDAEWELTILHCPILGVAREHPRICEMERNLIADVVGDNVTVRHRWRQPEGRATCVAVISHPVSSSSFNPA